MATTSKIFMGIKNVENVKIGLSDAKVYLGSTLVYEKNANEEENADD